MFSNCLTSKVIEKGLAKIGRFGEEMFNQIAKKLFGDRFSREMKKYQPILVEIQTIHTDLDKLSDDELQQRMQEIKSEIQSNLEPADEELENLHKEYQSEPNENQMKSL